ncbi:hypothetical protein [Thalassobacterium sedimentorum]|nr:hypothetical protein [Coraliomargarita sp. SDUM461004]
MRPLLALLIILVCVWSSGCESARRPSTYLAHFDLKHPQVEDFELCASAGCRQLSQLGYTQPEWQSICALFTPPPMNAQDERERIKIAIALTEQINGPKNGTAGDAPRNQRALGTGSQLDCIAEAANTTVTLMLLQEEGLLKFHSTGYPQHRGFFRLRLPHNTASIYENNTGDHYAVDSWFYKNGAPPVCVPVSEWKAGYTPEDL